MPIRFLDDLNVITANQLSGFFVGWSDPPNPETHLRILKGSYRAVLALDEQTGQVVGFVTAISDGVLSAYIPLLEVLPDYHDRGIGQALVARLLEMLKHLYMVDLLCDPDLQPYYERLGMRKGCGMMVRRYEYQSGVIYEDSDSPQGG
jgi:ribosomal protein S18 acetylase RimI-like enzyme